MPASPAVLSLEAARTFVRGGRAVFTLRNSQRGTRETFRVTARPLGGWDVWTNLDNPIGWVTPEGEFRLRGKFRQLAELREEIAASPKGGWVDNQPSFLDRVQDWMSRGVALTAPMEFRLRQAYALYQIREISEAPLRAKVFGWAWFRLFGEGLPPEVEIWHEGSCGCCSRPLTVPASIRLGIGPDCAQKRGRAEEWKALAKALAEGAASNNI